MTCSLSPLQNSCSRHLGSCPISLALIIFKALTQSQFFTYKMRRLYFFFLSFKLPSSSKFFDLFPNLCQWIGVLSHLLGLRSRRSIAEAPCSLRGLVHRRNSLEGLMLKLQFFGHLMRRANSLLMLEKAEGRRRRELQRMRWLDNITDTMDMNLSKLQETRAEEPDMLESMGWQSQTRLSN